MSENLITKDVQKLDPGSELVRLFELEYEKNSFIYFISGLDSDLTELQMRDYSNNAQINTYLALPSKIEGFEIKSEGAIARPTVTLANATTVLSNAIGTVDYQDFIGLKIIVRTTLKKYLYGESEDSSPPSEFPRGIFLMDRVKSRDKTQVTIECVSPFDLGDTRIPARNILPDRCPFIYQGASPDKNKYEKAQSGCIWHTEGKYTPTYKGTLNGTEYTVYVNTDDEYVVPSTVSFTAYTSGSVTINSYYSTTSTATRYAANGTSSSVTVTNYWQATGGFASPGTPSDTNSGFKRVRVYSSYSDGTEYFTYSDDRYNDYVTFTDNVASSSTYNKVMLWKAKAPSDGESPTTGSDFWMRGDGCSKRLNGCKARFGFDPITPGTGTSTGKPNSDTSAVLPFGGYPAAKAFS
jgi:lambda family phage minor tail protein L